MPVRVKFDSFSIAYRVRVNSIVQLIELSVLNTIILQDNFSSLFLHLFAISFKQTVNLLLLFLSTFSSAKRSTITLRYTFIYLL